ncbi:MAG: glycosyltransferase [Barrevirus sp.]|uniref:chitin synthase n=1 Tax=Barrevirus sp. TaxID=2487763 RepID=A0A3G4ZUR9_9VIRU|nr:MAG: glycosyltransferase [Barrevirus sp.]
MEPDNDIKGTSTITSLRITGHHDYKPEPNKCYFGLDNDNTLQLVEEINKDLPILIIGVCFYNENMFELRRTLVSLSQQIEELEGVANCQVLFVSDGHKQMSSDTKEYFKHIFCTTEEHVKIWDNLMISLDEHCCQVDEAWEDERREVAINLAKKKPPPLTYVIQNVSRKKKCRIPVEIVGAKDMVVRKLPLTLLLKGVNRRKHNSQEWILHSFAKQAVINTDIINDNDKNRFIFMSDCGTLFDPQCIYRLTKYMQSHPLCVGCTGRQRVMTAEEQDANGTEGIISIGKFFRIIQLGDYEASYAIYTGAFSAAGCLPVLPGPAALFRYSGLLSKRKFRALDPLEIELAKEITGIKTSNILDNDSVFLPYKEKKTSNILDNESTSLSYKDQKTSDEKTSEEKDKGKEEIEIVIENPPDFLATETEQQEEIEDLEQDDNIEKFYTMPLFGSERCIESVLEHFSSLVATPPDETDLVIENVKLAEDRIPSYAVVTHGKKGAYTTWVDGAVFKFQAETDLRSFVLQRRRWINGAFLCYIWNTICKPHLILGSKHNLVRRLLIYLLYMLQLLNYLLAAISPSIFSAALFIALTSIIGSDSTIIPTVIIAIYTVFILFFMWVHRYIVFVKPLFYLMVVFNALAMGIIISAYIKESIRWGFIPPTIDYLIIEICTVAIMFMPFLMSIVALDFKSLGYMLIACIPYWLFLPSLVGSFTIYSLARLGDISWGNRVSFSGSAFKGASQKQIADLQADLLSNSSVALVFISVLNIAIEIIVIYFQKNSWFIVACILVVFSTILIQVMVSFVYFVVKHLTCTTCRQRSKSKGRNKSQV